MKPENLEFFMWGFFSAIILLGGAILIIQGLF